MIDYSKIVETNFGDFILDNEAKRFYRLEMTRAMTGQAARENALVLRRVSRHQFVAATNGSK